MEKVTLSFHLYEIWQILKYFVGTFHQAHTLKCEAGLYVDNWICNFNFKSDFEGHKCKPWIICIHIDLGSRYIIILSKYVVCS